MNCFKCVKDMFIVCCRIYVIFKEVSVVLEII